MVMLVSPDGDVSKAFPAEKLEHVEWDILKRRGYRILYTTG